MKVAILTALLFLTFCASAQRINQVPDTLRKPIPNDQRDKTVKIVQEDGQQTVTAEDVIKNHLIKIALKNPAFTIDDANIEIAELNRKKAAASWLGSIRFGGNVNEFVINNSAAASFFPKYNFGLALPFDIVSRTKNDVRIAKQNIVIANAIKKQNELDIKAQTLTRYEDFKEKSDLVSLQNIILANNLADYELAQKNFQDGTITIEAVNNVYKNYMHERNLLITYKRDLSVSIVALEQMLGMPLEKAAPGLIVR